MFKNKGPLNFFGILKNNQLDLEKEKPVSIVANGHAQKIDIWAGLELIGKMSESNSSERENEKPSMGISNELLMMLATIIAALSMLLLLLPEII